MTVSRDQRGAVCILPEALLGRRKPTCEVQTGEGARFFPSSGAAGLLCICWWRGGEGRAGCRDSGAVVMLLEAYPADPRGVTGA